MKFCVALFLIYAFVPRSKGYCWGAGYNPGFTGPPKVEQLDIQTVRVSWGHGIVTHRDCADQFLVKYWVRVAPSDYMMTELVSRDDDYVDIKVTPKTTYMFQAVAREDKGPMGIDWNKSPSTVFKTSYYNQPPPEPAAPESSSSEDSEISPGQKSPVTSPVQRNSLPYRPPGKRPGQIMVVGMSLEMLALAIVGSVLVILIIIGIIYKVVHDKKTRASKNLNTASDDEPDEEAASVTPKETDALNQPHEQ